MPDELSPYNKGSSAGTELSHPGGTRAKTAIVVLYAATAFLSAFLLFQLQPLVAKHILPWFGGSAGVWMTCMIFFQGMLFFGYLYAHGSIRLLSPRRQAIIHIVLLLAAAGTLPALPSNTWEPTGAENPSLRITAMLLVSLGAPYLVLSATGPLVQAWFSRLLPGRSPYPLYAVSNAGSMLALLSYPFIVEPRFSTRAQAGFWSAGFVVFGLLCGICSVSASRKMNSVKTGTGNSDTTAAVSGGRKPGLLRTLRWAAFSATAVALFMSVTNQLCLNVAGAPFLWIIPLAVYLLTFILAFSGPRVYSRTVFSILLIPALVILYFLLKGSVTLPWLGKMEFRVLSQAALFAAVLFVLSMLCLGELYRLRPPPEHLTSYYLWISGGGALGGLFVGVVAAYLFPLYLEMHVSVAACCLLLSGSWFFDSGSRLRNGRPIIAWAAIALAFSAGFYFFFKQSKDMISGMTCIRRNFYGVLRVAERGREDPDKHRFILYHGTILHGLQFTSPRLSRQPTTYYGPVTAVGVLLNHFHTDQPRVAGIVGLGTGTLACYGRKKDVFHFYEINPAVERLAERYFTYLSDSGTECRVHIGDGRLLLERAVDIRFDVLVLDAFSGDAVPAHLLTREAFELYSARMADGGVIAVHISNRYLDLAPVVFAAADEIGIRAVKIRNTGNRLQERDPSTWILLASSEQTIDEILDAGSAYINEGEMSVVKHIPASGNTVLWTDTYSSLFPVLKKERFSSEKKIQP